MRPSTGDGDRWSTPRDISQEDQDQIPLGSQAISRLSHTMDPIGTEGFGYVAISTTKTQDQAQYRSENNTLYPYVANPISHGIEPLHKRLRLDQPEEQIATMSIPRIGRGLPRSNENQTQLESTTQSAPATFQWCGAIISLPPTICSPPSAVPEMATSATNFDSQGLSSYINSMEEGQNLASQPDPPGVSFDCPGQLDQMNPIGHEQDPSDMSFMNEFIVDEFLGDHPYPSRT